MEKESTCKKNNEEAEAFSLPATGYIRIKDVLKVIPIARCTWYKGISEGFYPKPKKLSRSTSAWRVEDIRALMKQIDEGIIDFGE